MKPEDIKKMFDTMAGLQKTVADLQSKLSSFDDLSNSVRDLEKWKEDRAFQQIAYPLDTTSKTIIGGAVGAGSGTTSKTQTYTVSGGGGGTIVGPKAYVQTVLVTIDGVNLELPSLI